MADALRIHFRILYVKSIVMTRVPYMFGMNVCQGSKDIGIPGNFSVGYAGRLPHMLWA
jgi:hypothetical protein